MKAVTEPLGVSRLNLRWCSDGLEFNCWNGEVIRLAFIIDVFDREIIAWTVVANASISRSDVRGMMLEAVETRFGATRAPHAIEHLSDNVLSAEENGLGSEGHEAVCPSPQFNALLYVSG